jgi:hypothetical protein
MSKPTTESILIEYQMAQESAQHHDNLIWNHTGIIWGAGLVSIGLVMPNLYDPALKFPMALVCVLAILMLIYLWKMVSILNSVMNQKYDRCKEIESILYLEQHKNLRYPKGLSRLFFSSIMTIFIFIWCLLLYYTLVG